MKQNLSFKHILTVAVCALSVASCSLDYEPKTGPSSGNFPANITEAEYGLYAAYKSLSTFDASSVAWWKVADNITDIGVTRVNTAKFTELVTSAATGENAVLVNAPRAAVIAGPVGIVLADSLLGECTAAMAAAVARSPAPKVLVPVNRCGVTVVGVEEKPLADYIADAAQRILALV